MKTANLVLHCAKALKHSAFTIVSKQQLLVYVAAYFLVSSGAVAGDGLRPISLHPENPHYFLWEGNQRCW